MNSVGSNKSFSISGCKDKGIRNFSLWQKSRNIVHPALYLFNIYNMTANLIKQGTEPYNLDIEHFSRIYIKFYFQGA